MGFGPSSLGAYSVERGIVAGVQYAKLLRNSAVPQPVRDPVSRNRLACGRRDYAVAKPVLSALRPYLDIAPELS